MITRTVDMEGNTKNIKINLNKKEYKEFCNTIDNCGKQISHTVSYEDDKTFTIELYNTNLEWGNTNLKTLLDKQYANSV